MGWRRRIDERKDGPAHGIRFVMYERDPEPKTEADRASTSVAIGSKKVKLDGRISLTLALGQYKHGDELIAQVYSREKARVQERHADGWSRVEVYLGHVDADLIWMLEQLLEDAKAAVRDAAR